MLRIEIHGLREVADSLHVPLDDILVGPLERVGAIVEAAWKRRVHTVTRKYQGSLGHIVSGTSVRIGPQPGFGSPRRYSRSQSARWRKPRDGTNRGDPQEYAVFEDQGTRYREGHPAAEPALEASLGQIVEAISDGIERAFR